LQELIIRGGITMVYQRWIQLQVTQWAALDILSTYSRRATNTLQSVDMSICLLSTARQNYGRLDDWRTMIEKLVDQPPQPFFRVPPQSSMLNRSCKLWNPNYPLRAAQFQFHLLSVHGQRNYGFSRTSSSNRYYWPKTL